MTLKKTNCGKDVLNPQSLSVKRIHVSLFPTSNLITLHSYSAERALAKCLHVHLLYSLIELGNNGFFFCILCR